jgi:hypothetical protein
MNHELLALLAIKKYIPVIAAALFGAVAHALEEIKTVGWRGWVGFITDIIICSFVGYAFYHMTLVIKPDYAVISTSLGSYWGTRGMRYIKNWFINSIKANIK